MGERTARGIPIVLVVGLIFGTAWSTPASAAAAGTSASETVSPLRQLPRSSGADRIFAGPGRIASPVLIEGPCDPATQEAFRWVSAAVMANGMPIIAYTARRPFVSGGDRDQDGYLHPRVAPYLAETVIARPFALDDPAIIGRSNGYDNETAVDVATNGAAGLIVVTFIDPLRHRVVVRRSTDLGATWSPIEKLSTLQNTFVDPYDIRGHYHQLYYDGLSGLFYFSFAFGNRDLIRYVTSADGVTWSPIRFWGRFSTSNGSNAFQSRIARVFRTKAGTWLMYGNLISFDNSNVSVARFGNGVCDTVTCFPTQQIDVWRWPGSEGSPPNQGRYVLHTPGAAFYLPASSTPDRIHLVFGATGLTGFHSVPTGHLHHFWSDDDGRTWWNENGLLSTNGSENSILGPADAETPVPEPPTGPLADIEGTWVPAFGKAVIWGVEGNNSNNAPGLGMSVFADGIRDQTRAQGAGGYKACSNTAPTLTLPGDQQIYLHDGLVETGAFEDPDVGQTWTGTVDYPDNVGPIPLQIAADHRFALVHRFKEPGTYVVRVVITDSQGASAAGSFQVTVVPKRVMLYVHGTTGSSDQSLNKNDFPSLFGRLFDHYGDVRFYRYYEDRAFAASDSDRSCNDNGRRVLPPIDPSAAMPLDPAYPDPADPDPGICDSSDDVELNAVLLDQDIADLGSEFDRVTILSNSGGTRIVRAFLAYSSNRVGISGARAVDLVDQVVFLEGVHQGSYLTVVFDDIDRVVERDPEAVIIRDRVLDVVAREAAHDPRRPLFEDVRPGSPNIRYTNSTVQIPDGPHYLNVDGDMRVHIHQSFFLIPLETQVVEWGDFVILPGDDDPRAVPERGGARFLPSVAGRGRSSTELELTREFNVNFDPTIAGVVIFQQIADLIDAPEMHMNLGKKLDAICVQHGGVRRLNEALFSQIVALDAGVAPTPGQLGFRRGEVACP